ncbi:MAG TPA: hypothetical protein VGT24_01585 [Candidatus Acidoferrales bacterium]|nr:hypothetical protein [Candidatus Acidoferrales bacterium]
MSQDFFIAGDVDAVVRSIADSFNREKVRSRSKAMDNLQSRLLANAQVLIGANYISFKELLGEIAELEKSVSQRKSSDIPVMDKVESFMQGLASTDIGDSEPLAPTHEISAEDEDEEEEDLTETHAANL